MQHECDYRQPTSAERALLDRLLEASFPGRGALAAMMDHILVSPFSDDNGSLDIRCAATTLSADVVQRVPVEAEGVDVDGTAIHVLLHVADGRPVELEVFKDDGSPVLRMPAPCELEVIVLPPPPSGR